MHSAFLCLHCQARKAVWLSRRPLICACERNQTSDRQFAVIFNRVTSWLLVKPSVALPEFFAVDTEAIVVVNRAMLPVVISSDTKCKPIIAFAQTGLALIVVIKAPPFQRSEICRRACRKILTVCFPGIKAVASSAPLCWSVKAIKFFFKAAMVMQFPEKPGLTAKPTIALHRLPSIWQLLQFYC